MPRVTRSLQPYFKHDGSKTMTGNLDLGNNDLLGGIESEVGQLAAWLKASYITSMYSATSFLNLFWGRATETGFRTRDVLNGAVNFYGSYGANSFAARLENTALNETEFSIARAGNIIVLANKVLNFGSNPILYTPLKHICPFDLIGGATDVYIQTFPSGEFTQDMHVDKIIVSIDQPAGAGKTVTVEVSDGTNTMTVTITGDTDVVGSTTTNNFDLDVSAESLTLHYSQTAGGAAVAGTIICVHHYITNV